MGGMTAGRTVPAGGQLVCAGGEAVLLAVGVCPLGVDVGVEPVVLVLQELSSAKQMLINKRKNLGVFQDFIKTLLYLWLPWEAGAA